MELFPDTVLEWTCNNLKLDKQTNSTEPVRERVVLVDRATKQVALIRLCVDKALPEWVSFDRLQKAFADGTLIRAANDLWGPTHLNKRQTEKWKIEWRDNSWKLIKPLIDARFVRQLFARNTRRSLIKERAKTAKVCENTVRKALRHYFQRGRCRDALLPDFHRCGAPGVTRAVGLGKRGRPRKNGMANLSISEKARELLQKGFRKNYVENSDANWLDAYTATIGEYFSKGCICKDGVIIPILKKKGTYPTLDQFKYWASQDVKPVSVVRKRIGERRFLKGKRGLVGSSMEMAFGPGLFQIDCTVADIYLKSTIGECVVGRPVLYIVIDVFTRLIVGYYLSLDPPSGQTAMLAMIITGCDKVKHCHSLDITILPEEWPAHHLPGWIIGDRGEMLSERLDSLAGKLGIDTSNTPPYRCDLKGIVERCFGKLNNRIIKWLPGHVKKDRERGCPDPRLQAKLTLRDFERLIVRAILAHNRSHIPSYPRREYHISKRVPSIPIALWNYAIEHGDNNLLPYDQNRVYLATLKADTAVVRKDGIRFNKLRYQCKQARDEDWLSHARIFGSKTIQIVFNPDRVGSVFHPLPSGLLEPLQLVDDDKHFEYCSVSEIAEHFERKGEDNRDGAHNNLQVRLELNAHKEAVVAAAENNSQTSEKDDAAPRNKRKKAKNIRAARANEQQTQRLKRIGAPGSIQSANGDFSDDAETPKNIVPFHKENSNLAKGQADYVPPPQDLDLLD